MGLNSYSVPELLFVHMWWGGLPSRHFFSFKVESTGMINSVDSVLSDDYIAWNIDEHLRNRKKSRVHP